MISDPLFVVPGRTDATTVFPPINPAEAVVLTFDYADELPAGTTLAASPSVQVTVTAGTDAGAPADVLNGSAALDHTSTQVLVPVIGAVAGCDYLVTVTAVVASNPTLTLNRHGLLQVREIG